MTVVAIDCAKEIAVLKKASTGARDYLHEFILKHARALISSSGNVPGIVQITPPHSKGTKGVAAKKQGEASARRDILKVYGTESTLYALIKEKNRGMANAFWKRLKANEIEEANKIAMATVGRRLAPFDGGRLHRSLRVKGKVKGGGRARDRGAFVQPADGKELTSYIKTVVGRVGLLAAATLASARVKLGELKGIPGWVSRHLTKTNEGSVLVLRSPQETSVEIANTSARQPPDMQRRFDYALGYRLKAMQRDLEAAAKAIETKLQSQLQ